MKSSSLASALIIAGLFIVLLIVGKSLLIPFAIAVVIWFLINALSKVFGRIKIKGKPLPMWFRLLMSSLTMLGFLFVVGELIQTNVSAMTQAVPEYRVNVERILGDVQEAFGIKEIPQITTLLNDIDLPKMISGLLNAISTMLGNAFLILIYVMFLIFEQTTFNKKIHALFPDNDQFSKVNHMLKRIGEASMTYVGVKFITSSITGLLSYFVLSIVGVDFAVFWAFLIFLLNFIPTVGSLIATAFPALLALVQFDTFQPALWVLIGVGAIQILVGNMLEPRLMGNSMNISPLVVILSLSLWGAIWGIPGMFLCVPFTVIMMIIFAQFPKTRAIAVMLSANGNILNIIENKSK